MGKVGDDRPVHLEVYLDRRAAELGMGGCGCVRCAQSADPGYVAGQFNDALVVDVIQHKWNSRAQRLDQPHGVDLTLAATERRPWRGEPTVLYMVGDGGKIAAIVAQQRARLPDKSNLGARRLAVRRPVCR